MEFCYNPGGLILNPERKSKQPGAIRILLVWILLACLQFAQVQSSQMYCLLSSPTYDSIISCISLVLNVRYIIITNILRTNIARVCDAASYCFVNEFQRNKIIIKQQKKWNNFLALSALVSFLISGGINSCRFWKKYWYTV